MWTVFLEEYSCQSQCRWFAWWRHQMETFSALLVLCAVNSPVTGEFPAQRPVTRSFDVFYDLRLNKPLSKQSWGWWFETQSRPLWRHRNGDTMMLRLRYCTGPFFCYQRSRCFDFFARSRRSHWIMSKNPWIILAMGSANERRRYIVTASLKNDPWG